MSDGVCGSGQGKSVAEALNGDGDKSIITCNSSPMVREKVPGKKTCFSHTEMKV